MEQRLGFLHSLVVVACGLLALRLADLQVIRGRHYRQLADQNCLRLVPESAPRGLIVDRHARILAANQTVFHIAVIPQEATDLPALFSRVAAVTGRSRETLQRAFTRERSLAFLPATIVTRVAKEAALRLEEEQWKWPGLLVRAESVRHYPLGMSAAPLLGYLNQPTAEEMPLLKQYGVRPQELIGRQGLEQALDHALRGRPGGRLVEVNHRARSVRDIGRREPQPGATVVLSLDAPLQSLIETSFGTQPGAAVVLDPENGAVLAMVSMPSFAPEAFAASEQTLVNQYQTDPQSPLMNRATLGVYQPGSTVKLITGSAALEQHVATPSASVACPGFMNIGKSTIHCWNRDGHGPMNLREALMQSCNVYFIHMGRNVGLSSLRSAMEQIGLSRRTGWPLDEQAGHLPTRRLTEGEVAQLSIGQGPILVTPLQAAVMASAFATKGGMVEPWVVKTIANRPVPHRGVVRRLPWSAATFEAIREGMRLVVADAQGTGHRAFSPKVSIAGKTGTAQTHVPGRAHGWFVGFCPIEQPRAAFAIVTEHGGSGSELPSDIARAVCEYVAVMDERR
ncbi:MAG: penicillin-binding protein 2 [Candidatus Omnitrophica bacterium]|nr:penicillin-binding protein 2 [Candidatus Omnitrophota bacterium]